MRLTGHFAGKIAASPRRVKGERGNARNPLKRELPVLRANSERYPFTETSYFSSKQRNTPLFLGHDVARLGVFEVLAERGVETVAQAEELDGVKGSLGDSLLHLDPAGAAFGGADLDVAVAQPSEQTTAGPERSPEAIACQPEGTSHARAATVDEFDVELEDVAQQIEPGVPTSRARRWHGW